MTNQRLTEVLKRLTTDRDFVRSLRHDPDHTLRSYELTEQEVEAVKDGDEGKLAALGADLSSFFCPRESRSFPKSLLLKLAPVPLALALLAGAAMVDSSSARAIRITRGTRRAGRRLDGQWRDPGPGLARDKQQELQQGAVDHNLPLPIFDGIHTEK